MRTIIVPTPVPRADEFIAKVREMIGWRFVRGGRSVGATDCVGLVNMAAQYLGYRFEDYTDYSHRPSGMEMREYFYANTDALPKPGPRPGAIVILRQSTVPMHVGVVDKDKYGRPTIINANVQHRRVVEQPISDWQKLILDYRRLPDMHV